MSDASDPFIFNFVRVSSLYPPVESTMPEALLDVPMFTIPEPPIAELTITSYTVEKFSLPVVVEFGSTDIVSDKLLPSEPVPLIVNVLVPAIPPVCIITLSPVSVIFAEISEVPIIPEVLLWLANLNETAPKASACEIITLFVDE